MRRDQAEPVEPLQLPDHCELRRCVCRGYGKPEVAIRKGTTTYGYVCQAGYFARLHELGLDQASCHKETGAFLGTPQQSFEAMTQAHHFADIVSDLDALADRYAQDQEEAL